MLYRPHKGGYDESMALACSVLTMSDLVRQVALQVGRKVDEQEVEITPYESEARNNWDTHLVVVRELGPVGFTSGPVLA